MTYANVDVRILTLTVVLFTLTTLVLLSQFTYFSKPTNARQLRQTLIPAQALAPSPSARLTTQIVKIAEHLGDRFSRVFGIRTSLDDRLRLGRYEVTARQFRNQQFATGLMCAVVGLGLARVVGLTPVGGLIAVTIAILLGLALPEERLNQSVVKTRQSIASELPLFTERLAMLVSSGQSVTSAVTRIATSSDSALALELRDALAQTESGTQLKHALQDTARRSDSRAFEQIVQLVASERDTPNLANLLYDQAGSQRQVRHRELIETLDKRAQAVWIPVTVATLVPGVIFLAIPFLSALQPLST